MTTGSSAVELAERLHAGECACGDRAAHEQREGVSYLATVVAAARGVAGAQVDADVAPAPAPSVPAGRTGAYVALALALLAEIAQRVVVDQSLLSGLPQSVSEPVVSVAQIALVFWAAYRARPATAPSP
jgi:hypothetical protein